MWSSVVRASETKPLSGAGLPWSSGGAAGQPVHLGVTECHRAHPPQLPSSWGRCLRPLGLTTTLGRLAIPGDSLVVTVEVQWVEARDVLNALLCTGQPPLRRVSPRPQRSQSRPLVQMPVMLSGQCQGLPIPLLPLLGGARSPCCLWLGCLWAPTRSPGGSSGVLFLSLQPFPGHKRLPLPSSLWCLHPPPRLWEVQPLLPVVSLVLTRAPPEQECRGGWWGSGGL